MEARRALAIQAALEQRSTHQEQFDTVNADIYINNEITKILTKSAILSNVDENSGDILHNGEHIVLLRTVLKLWGCLQEVKEEGDVPVDKWDEAAISAWRKWVEQRSHLEISADCLNAASINHLMDKDAFEEYLQVAFPVKEITDEDDILHTVEIKELVEDDTMVEAVDEETGQLLRLTLPRGQVQEVQSRLSAGLGRVFARADSVSGRMTALMSPEEFSLKSPQSDGLDCFS